MTAAITTTEIFLIAMGIIFTVPYLFWRVLRTDYYAPLVVVQIVAGILLGPGILGRIFPGYYAYVFRPEVIALLNGIAWWAVMLFVFIAGIELDLAAHQASRRGERLTLTKTEFALLELFLRNPGRVLSRTQIFESVWGYDFGPESNGLWVYIGYLRRKMGEPRLIQTVRGIGYVLREEP